MNVAMSYPSGSQRYRRWCTSILLAVLLAVTAMAPAAKARDVQKLTSPAGFNIWLVEDHGVPLVALGFALRGGSLLDPPGKEGVGSLFAQMMDEGAGDLDANSFKSRLANLGAQLSFSVSQRALTGGLVTLKRNVEEAAQLLKLALHEPRVDEAEFERTKRQAVALLAFEQRNPQRLAVRKFYEAAFEGHPYANAVQGTAESLGKLTVEDVRSQGAKLIDSSQLHVVIVGAIDASEATRLVDEVFSALPSGQAQQHSPAVVAPAKISKNIASLPGHAVATAVFALPMPRLDDPNFFTAMALNHILGSGNFDAWLTEEVRVKRGLTYAISSSIIADPAASFSLGVLTTKPDNMDQALEAVRAVYQRMKTNGPTQRDLSNAKNSLNGAYLLGIDTSAKLANRLLGLWVDGLDSDYASTRQRGLNGVTPANAKKVARRIFDPDELRFLVMRPAKQSSTEAN
jgi:zinc protease